MTLNPVPTRLVVMGVAGCGKSSLGQHGARALGLPLLEGDDFHPAANVAKMRSGIALSDDDRAAWLDTLAEQLALRPEGVVLTCSSLKRRYRDRLRAAAPGLRFVFLQLTREQARERVATRPGHLFPVSLVDSQFEALEDPSAEPGVLALDAMRPIPELVSAVAQWVRSAPAPRQEVKA
ncbi:MAG: gluconokinase [Hydrogenophaga sp.]|uniref:Gluconokinase n=1 Tax=Hydrogenophaga crocea TaxID=2716225 RepID=A0A6G8IH65_9BURK|nr:MULTISPECIES: gluconokinase [Hydrogenophaga]MBL0945830.1 gluconokinase [Hydrogenophaga sp.]QIM52532.1 gluconokinase [Hydrogenophaga crocea]